MAFVSEGGGRWVVFRVRGVGGCGCWLMRMSWVEYIMRSEGRVGWEGIISKIRNSSLRVHGIMMSFDILLEFWGFIHDYDVFV